MRTHAPLSLPLRFAIIALAIHGALDLARSVLAEEDHAAYFPLTQNPGSLEDRVAALEYKLANVVASSDAITVTGVNLYVVNGTGTTDGEPNGLGNLVVGYNELRGGTEPYNERSGSHMVIVGKEHSYTRYGGLVDGRRNNAIGDWSSVTGGSCNTSEGHYATVSGGWANRASGEASSVSGGAFNEAGGLYSSVTGGSVNKATWSTAAGSGGDWNVASGSGASVTGGITKTQKAPSPQSPAANTTVQMPTIL